uniref:Uncharacterized protein n=1 Tax=Zea mays TaxID=4577 RepID=C4J715_MAIZE|nr:unknown [Zea mays]
MANMKAATTNSSLRAPNLSTPRSSSVLSTVRTTPAHTGIPSRMLNAKAVPSTSGMSSDITASSAMIHRQMLTERGYSSLQSSARCLPVFTPRLAASVWIRSAKTIPTKITHRSWYLKSAPACMSVSKLLGSRKPMATRAPGPTWAKNRLHFRCTRNRSSSPPSTTALSTRSPASPPPLRSAASRRAASRPISPGVSSPACSIFCTS